MKTLTEKATDICSMPIAHCLLHNVKS